MSLNSLDIIDMVRAGGYATREDYESLRSTLNDMLADPEFGYSDAELDRQAINRTMGFVSSCGLSEVADSIRAAAVEHFPQFHIEEFDLNEEGEPVSDYSFLNEARVQEKWDAEVMEAAAEGLEPEDR